MHKAIVQRECTIAGTMNVQYPDNHNVQPDCTSWLYYRYTKGWQVWVTKGMYIVDTKGIGITVPFELSFEKRNHVYRVFNEEIPSVTTVMKAAGTYSSYADIPSHILERAADIGNEVHRVVEKWAKEGDWALETDDSSAAAYLVGFKDFIRMGVFTPLHSEIQLYDPDLWYAGTIDLVGEMNDRLCIIDVKTTNKLNENAIGLQTAAYENLIGLWGADLIEFYGGVMDRFALHLTKTGKWSFYRADDPTDWGFFKQALELYNG